VLTDDLRRHAGKFYGKYRGIVMENKDENFQGLLAVAVPSVFGEKAIVHAKACMPYGHFFVPPPETQVWVEFEEGDPKSPIWSGAWLPVKKAPVEAQMDPPDSRVIQTPAGHTIQIVDKEGEEKIIIRHAKDAFVSIDAKGSVLLSNANGSHIHLDADGAKATIVEEHGNHFVMTDKGMLFVNNEGAALNITGDTVHINAAKAILAATNVALGANAAEPTIMGNAFSQLWMQMLLHVHPSAMGPTGPSPQLAALQLIPTTHLSSSVVVK